jgi:sugar phosphate isomerase/epimerase
VRSEQGGCSTGGAQWPQEWRRGGRPGAPVSLASGDHLSAGPDGVAIRALNAAGYTGPLSVEWEDSGMDREYGAKEAYEFVKKLNFKSSAVAFDAAFERK